MDTQYILTHLSEYLGLQYPNAIVKNVLTIARLVLECINY